MISGKLTLAAALVAASTLTAYAQTNSSNPTQAPSAGAASSPGDTARPDSSGSTANVPGVSDPVDPSQNSSHPSQAPTNGSTTGAMHHQDLRPGTGGNRGPEGSSLNPKTPTR
jgi:hypothetical protein